MRRVSSPPSPASEAPQASTGLQPIEAAGAPLDRRDWIAGLQKGLSIIETFDYAHPRMTAAQVGLRTGLSRTAARRHLLTLTALGYVASDGKQFWLTPSVLRLGHSYLESARLPRLVQPYLQRVTAGTLETAFLSVLDGSDIIYLARSGSNVYMNTGYVVGARVQAQVTSAGLLLLALSEPAFTEHWLQTQTLKPYTTHTITDKAVLRKLLAQTRLQRWCISEQQLELGMRGVAVPLLDMRGDLVGTLNVTMPIGNESAEHAVKRVLPLLQDTARSLRNLI